MYTEYFGATGRASSNVILNPLFNTFPPNPFQDVRRAISEFYVLVLALAQETNRRKIDEDNLRQVENCD
jgi:hypothetical protein